MGNKVIFFKDGKLRCKDMTDAAFKKLSICGYGEIISIITKEEAAQMLDLTEKA